MYKSKVIQTYNEIKQRDKLSPESEKVNFSLHLFLGVSAPAVSQWPDIIPERCALLLDRHPDFPLSYDPKLYGRENFPPVDAAMVDDDE